MSKVDPMGWQHLGIKIPALRSFTAKEGEAHQKGPSRTIEADRAYAGLFGSVLGDKLKTLLGGSWDVGAVPNWAYNPTYNLSDWLCVGYPVTPSVSRVMSRVLSSY